jgi:AbrB family looped-hinge helix DNA binding protein
MRITSKGQVTIPQGIREKAGLTPGAEVEVWIGDDGVVRLGAKPAASDRFVEHLERIKGVATSGMTTDEILALTRR